MLPWLISGTSLLIKGTNNLLYLGILSVFLRNYGSEFLPWFYIILNISFISFQFGVTPHIIGKEGHPLLFAVSVFTAALTLCAGFLIDSNHLITLILCLAFARLIDLITNQAFSAMTNELFTIRESKKYLSYAYAAGSFGYILSGLMLKFVIEITGINGLLWLNGIGVLFLLALLRGINRIYKEGDTHQSGESAHNKSDNPIPANKTEKKSASVPTFKQPLARDLSLAAFFIVFNTFMTDFLYSGIISGYFSDSDSLASFMGVFGAATDLSVILMQASIMNWVFTAVPIGKALSILPVLLSVLCFAASLSPTFAVVVFIQYLVVVNSKNFTQPSTVILMGAMKQKDRVYYRRDMSVMSSAGSLLVGIVLLTTKNFLSHEALFLWVGIFYIIMALIHYRLDASYAATLQDSLAIGQMGEEQDLSKMLDYLGAEERLKKIQKMLVHSAPSVRLSAIKALDKVDSENAGILLKQILSVETERICIVEAAKMIILHFKNDSWEMLGEVTQNARDDRLVADIVEAMGYSDGVQSFEEKLKQFIDSQHHRIRSNAIMSLLRVTKSKKMIDYALRELAKMAGSANKMFRAASVAIMGELEMPLFVPALEVLAFDIEPGVCKAAAAALYKIRTPKAVALLERMSESESKEVGQIALRYYEQASAENVKRLNVLLHSLSGSERLSMVAGIKAIGAKGLSGLMTRILELELSAVRQNLVRLLSEGDSRVAELIKKTLDYLDKDSSNAFKPILESLPAEGCNKSNALGVLAESAAMILRARNNREPQMRFCRDLFKMALERDYSSGRDKYIKNCVEIAALSSEAPSIVMSAFDSACTGDTFSRSVSEEVFGKYFDKETCALLMKLSKIRCEETKK